MGKVFVNMGMSLDGFVAGPNGSPENQMGGRAMDIHAWVFQQRAFREHLGIGTGGETGADNARLEHTFGRIGANIMGKRMFDEGEVSWPEKAPFGGPVFVLTHETRASWPRPGGTTFHFVNDDLAKVLARAKEAAGDKDVRISGGADIVRQYLNAGLVDELELAVAPIFLGEGLRLFDGIDGKRVKLEIAPEEAGHSPAVTHLRYALKRPAA